MQDIFKASFGAKESNCGMFLPSSEAFTPNWGKELRFAFS